MLLNRREILGRSRDSRIIIPNFEIHSYVQIQVDWDQSLFIFISGLQLDSSKNFQVTSVVILFGQKLIFFTSLGVLIFAESTDI